MKNRFTEIRDDTEEVAKHDHSGLEDAHTQPVFSETKPGRMFMEALSEEELAFEYQLPNIVECTQTRIFGKKEGTTKVLVYEKGEVEPLKELTFTVHKRNRVTDITLSDYALSLGVGDRYSLSMQAVPENGDNLEKLRWYSDNEAVAVVDKRGTITVRSAGKCNIFCAVEKVYATCAVESKPYLEKIALSSFFETDHVTMTIGEEQPLGLQLTPPDAYDKNIQISCSNYMVANVKEDVVSAVGLGETELFQKSAGSRITRKIHVTVTGKGKKRKKRGFFSFLGN